MDRNSLNDLIRNSLNGIETQWNRNIIWKIAKPNCVNNISSHDGIDANFSEWSIDSTLREVVAYRQGRQPTWSWIAFRIKAIPILAQTRRVAPQAPLPGRLEACQVCVQVLGPPSAHLPKGVLIGRFQPVMFKESQRRHGHWIVARAPIAANPTQLDRESSGRREIAAISCTFVGSPRLSLDCRLELTCHIICRTQAPPPCVCWLSATCTSARAPAACHRISSTSMCVLST